MSDVTVPKRIYHLPQFVADQIAAGEVIERPASVVKELLENSLDADSTDIRIEIEGGGSRLIRVIDNGGGIHKDDLLLSLDRHATSKIRQIDDLLALKSLGFRGEALASIAAVAGIRLISRTVSDDTGYELIKFPEDQAPVFQPAAHPPGTTVEISELFSYVPARKKFLKSEKTELLHILALVKRLALSGFNTRFRLMHDGRNLFRCTSAYQDPTQRITDVCGKEFIRNTSLIEFKQNDTHLWGWLGQPGYNRSQGDQQYFYLNGRIIRDRQINHAIRSAYQGLIHPGRHPVYVLYLEMDPGMVDINVHPTKHEVRFRDTREIYDFLRGSLISVLDDKTVNTTGSYQINQAGKKGETINELPDSYHSFQSGFTSYQAGDTTELTCFPLFNGRYLLVQKSEQVMLIDSYLSRETITKVSIKNDIAGDKLVTRPLLIPLMINLSVSEMKIANDHQQILNRLGILMEQAGPETFRVREVPALLAQADILSMINDLLKILTVPGIRENEDALIDSMASHVNDGICHLPTLDEVKGLLEKIESLKTELQSTEFGKLMKFLDKQTIKRFLCS